MFALPPVLNLCPSGAWSGIYLAGTFAPLRLASESPMAMACFLLLTRVPLFPLFKLPVFSLCIARLTDRCALLPYLAIRYSFLTYCHPENKVSSLGLVEWLNNKIRVLQRRAYGYR